MARITERVGKRIRALRIVAGLSQEQLAFRAKLHRTYLSDVERGTRNISIENLEKIATALGVHTKDLVI